MRTGSGSSFRPYTNFNVKKLLAGREECPRARHTSYLLCCMMTKRSASYHLALGYTYIYIDIDLFLFLNFSSPRSSIISVPAPNCCQAIASTDHLVFTNYRVLMLVSGCVIHLRSHDSVPNATTFNRDFPGSTNATPPAIRENCSDDRSSAFLLLLPLWN